MIWFILKILAVLVTIIIAYFLHKLVIIPLLNRRKYGKYCNVYMRKKFIPVIGDYYQFFEDEKQGKVCYYSYYQEADERDKYDLYLMHEGFEDTIKIQSHQAQKEFAELLKAGAIDREPDVIAIGRFGFNSLGNCTSTKDFENRRKIFMNFLGFNSSSKYIPLIVNCVKKSLNSWKVGDNYKFVYQMNRLMFSIITSVLFGKDVEQISSKLIEYENRNGVIERIETRDAFLLIFKDLFQGYLNPIGLTFHFVAKYGLINPFKRDKRNVNVFKDNFKESINELSEENSIVNLVRSLNEIPEEILLDDIIGFLAGGADTSAHLITSAIYYLFRNKDKLDKLLVELDSFGFKNFERIDDKIERDTIQGMEYLNYVIKEALRLDPPTFDTLSYMTQQNIIICGVPVPKDTNIRIDFTCRHLSSLDWQQPFEFIPERFDPSSKFFDRPTNDTKSRSSYSHIPFSHGMRSCPGQTFALLQVKIVLIYLLTQVEFSLDSEIMNNNEMGFGMYTTNDLPFTVSKLSKVQ